MHSFFPQATSRSRRCTRYGDLPALRRLNAILRTDIDGLHGAKSNPVQEKNSQTLSPAPQDIASACFTFHGFEKFADDHVVVAEG